MATAAWLHGPNNTRLTEGLLSVLKEERPEYLPALLANYREHGVVGSQNSGAVGGLVGISNLRLGSSKTRFEGLCLLSVLVKDSSSEVFHQHCLSWLRSLQQIIQSQAPLPSVQLAVSVLQDLLQYSSQLPELAREVGLNSILGILTSLLGLKSECHLAAMEGMMACMRYYPRACGSLKEKLGVYFLSKMDSDNPKVQEVACECYGRLPCLGGVLERGGGGRRAEGWTNQVHCLLASANSILGQLYQGIETEETIQYDGPGVELPFPPLDDIDPLLILQLRQRYKAVCLALKHTLSVDPATPVRISIQHVLNLVCRALAVTNKSINVTGEGCLKLLVLPSIHSDSLELLSALIKAVGGGLVQYCSVLTRLFSQSLSAWTPLPEASLGQQRAYSTVRVAIYCTLELWVHVGGASSSVLQGSTSHSEMLFAHLMGDITPGTEAVKLRAGQTALSDFVGAAGKAGPRRTKGLGIGDQAGVSLQRKGDALANQDTCFAALRALRQIILTSGTVLKEDLHKRLQDLVVPLCVRLQQQAQCGAEVAGVSGQYGSASPRRELYRLLLALILVPSPRWPPPLSCAVSVFSQGRRDRSIMVSSFCAEALTICNTLLHPRSPSISLPLPPLTLKPTPAAPVLGSTQNPSLSLPTLLGGPAPGPSFPARHPLGLGPVALLGTLENHLPLAPPVLPTPPGATGAQSDLLLSPAQPAELAGLGAPEGQRQVFVRYDKEEPEDVEISLESDSDDSVVIMPQGMMLEMQEGASNAQTLPAPSGGTMPTPAEVGSVETSLPNELPTSISHQILPTDSNNINSFSGPGQADQLVSLVPPLNSTAVSLAASPGGLGNSLPAGPQLQQMLMQPSPGGQSAQLGLSLHMQLQSQLAQTSRQLQQQQPSSAPEEDQNVININSSDDEEEEDEEMEDEDELGEEEEEEEGLEEDEEEEEGSDFPEEEEFYPGEEYEDFEEEEGEEMEEEEEEEEEEEVQPLEGEDQRAVMGEEEGEVMIEEQEERRIDAFHVEREGQVEAGIEEMEGVRSIYGEEGMKDKVSVEEIENIGAVERNESEASEPQIEARVIVDEAEEVREGTSAAATAAAAPPEQDVRPWEQEGTGQEPVPEAPEDSAIPKESQEVAAEAGVSEQSAEGEQEETANQSTASTSEEVPSQQAEEAAVKEKDEGQQEEEEEARGTKRKIEDCEEGERSEQGSEKKKLDDEAMASMLADFVDCPPDDEDHGASQSHS
ncbi:proline-, glutamic acid- and leucine-rich protein 1 [Pygocentrus nattereri]|uniref:Proline-, glutamic acid- and leucine-rich protein 1 n=1 Tax=Pygocentrus nattereri TaxID=42514 RepID=A0A3B4CPL2_PYGNA|nr:proline-, glutamic acid- and leucine-rich protein 1 [Pygocentrus nattereri]